VSNQVAFSMLTGQLSKPAKKQTAQPKATQNSRAIEDSSQSRTENGLNAATQALIFTRRCSNCFFVEPNIKSFNSAAVLMLLDLNLQTCCHREFDV
jgi:uncharacterized membrane protein